MFHLSRHEIRRCMRKGFRTQREIFSKSYKTRLKSDCIYHFPINLEPNGRPFDLIRLRKNISVCTTTGSAALISCELRSGGRVWNIQISIGNSFI